MDSNNYGQPGRWQCAHASIYAQIVPQGTHVQCYNCGTMTTYTTGVRELAALARARLDLDIKLRAREQAHIAQFGRVSAASMPLAAGQGVTGPRWWGR